MDYRMKIGYRLAENRAQKGFTREEAHYRSGVPASTIKNYENGRIPGIETLEKLAELYGCQVKDFF